VPLARMLAAPWVVFPGNPAAYVASSNGLAEITPVIIPADHAIAAKSGARNLLTCAKVSSYTNKMT
jgi:hypothetical protein